MSKKDHATHDPPRRYHNGQWGGDSIFVFGSNLAGRHGAGAAKYARDYAGAVYGEGQGLQGNSYAIPTKDERIQTLPLEVIQEYVEQFISFAEEMPYTEFFVTAVGTGLAGYSHEEIAPMFSGAPENCVLPIEWKGVLE